MVDYQPPHQENIVPAAIVEAVRAKTKASSQTNCCCDSGCCMSLEGIPEPYVLINLEHDDAPRHRDHSPSHNHPHCDFLLIAGDDDDGGPWVAPIELTTGNKDGHLLLRQLRAGADIADDLLPVDVSFRFRPILAHDGRLNRYVITEVLYRQSSNVQLRGESEPIELTHCRETLADSLFE